MNSIRNQLMARLLGGLILISVLCGATLYAFVARALTAQFDDSLRGKAGAFAALSDQAEEEEGEQRVALEDLSAAVRASIAEHTKDAVVAEIEQVPQGDRFFYKVEIIRGGQESEFLVNALGQYLGENDEFGFAFDQAALPEFQPGPEPEYYQVWDEDGDMLAKSPSLENADLARPAAAIDRQAMLFDTVLPDGRAGRAMAFSFVPRFQGQAGGTNASGERVWLVMARARTALDRTLRILLSGLLISEALLLAAAVLMVRWSVRKGLRPLDAVARQAARIDAGNLEGRFPTAGMPREMIPICTHLNELLDRLEAAFARERRFTADVAHELRTPIAELRSLAEVGLSSIPGLRDDENLAQYFHDAKAIALQMERLVNTLLSLARCEAGQHTVEFKCSDLAAMLSDAWRPFADTARKRELKVRFDMPDHVHIETDPAMLNSLLTNLLSNAAVYTPRGGGIEIALEQKQDRVQLRIANTNDQLSQDDVPCLFEPFWRKDAARSDPSHSGIGLAVVAAYARALGIIIDASLPSGDRFQVALTCPKPRG